ncbi:8225_t:CDS:2, partial [Cetraspora pellucida]
FEQQHFSENVPSQSDDLFAIISTSGTTGLPKGVMLSHSNLLAALCSVYYEAEEPPGSRIISYLPLAHIFGILIEGFAIRVGCSVGYFSGDQNRFLEDVQVLQPISFPSVPRIFNKLYLSMRTATIDAPCEEGEKKILDVNVRSLLCGVAPLSEDVVEFLRVAPGVIFAQGYEQTESAGTRTRVLIGDLITSH